MGTRQAQISIYPDRGGGYRWRLRAGNGHIVADSGGAYTRRRDAVRAARRLVRLVRGRLEITGEEAFRPTVPIGLRRAGGPAAS